MSPRGSAAVEITVVWARQPRKLRLGRWSGAALLVALPLLAACCLCGSLYLVFHDDLLASLIKRQADMQYAYEDRIATLKADLDGLTGDPTASQDVSSQDLRKLAAQAERLEARAAVLERLAARPDAGTLVTTPFALVPRSEHAQAASTPLQRLGSYPDRRLDAVATALDRSEAAEGMAARRLREPMLKRLARVETALEETGLPPSRWHGHDALGGPFVPLPGATDLDTSIALLREAAVEQDRLGRVVETIPLHRPLDGAMEVTSPFGPRVDPFLGRAALHTGIDLREETGDAVKATAAGTVTIAGPDGGYGNLVEIDHGQGIATRYGHLSAIEVAVGQRVAAGTSIGRVGATGRATGPHLHYETRIAGEPVDPARFLKASAILFPEQPDPGDLGRR